MIRNNFLIFLNLILIVLALWFFDASNIDVSIQNHLFDFEKNAWLVDEHEPVKKFIFYNFPKILFALVIVFCAFKAIKTKLEERKNLSINDTKQQELHPILHGSSSSISTRHNRYVLIVLGLILIPLIAGNIKKFTNIYCPKQLEIYNGSNPYVKILHHYPTNFVQEKAGKCFPAGHCITGFAFFILFFALKKKRNRIFALLGAFFAGWILGFYQMIKGAHFFGDTVISMLLCFFLAAIISKIYNSRLPKTQN